MLPYPQEFSDECSILIFLPRAQDLLFCVVCTFDMSESRTPFSGGCTSALGLKHMLRTFCPRAPEQRIRSYQSILGQP